ncbi:MAG TPA: MFS transporter [Acidimicrobiales bacterium]|nr:MFS transporter [Acidimicrobiales bacterium]
MLSLRAPSRTSIALAVIVTCQLMMVLDATVVNIALSPIQHSLHFSPAGLSWVIDAYSLAFGGLLLLGGRAGDVFGRRRMLMVGLVIFTAASLLGGLATSATWLVVTRAIQGVGAAMASPSTLSLISATFEEGPARNKALGVFTAMSAGGGSLGLILGGALTSWVSWRWVLFINVPIGLAIIFLAPRFVPEPPRNRGRLDFLGAGLVTAGIGLVIYGFIRIGEHTSGSVLTAAAFAAAVALLGGFVLVEQRVERPLMPLRLLTDRARGSAYLDILLVPAAMYGMFFFMSQFLENSLHYSALTTGFAFLPLTALIFASSRVTPRIVARVGARPLLITGLVLLTGALVWISQVTPESGYASGVLGPLILFGLGAGASFLPISVVILSGVRRDDAGAASGMLQSMQQTGGALGVAILVSVASSAGRSDALLTAAGLTLVALVVAIVNVRQRQPLLGAGAGAPVESGADAGAGAGGGAGAGEPVVVSVD